MKYNLNEHTKETIKALTISGCLIIFIGFLFSRWDAIYGFFAKITSAMQPFLWGFAIAFVQRPLQRLVEYRWLKDSRLSDKSRHFAGIAVSMIVFLLILTAFFSVLIPQLVSSFKTLSESMDSYLNTLDGYLNKINENGQLSGVINDGVSSLQKNLQTFMNGPDGLISQVVDYSMSMVKSIFNFFMGLIVAIYLMNTPKRWKRQFKTVIYAIFPQRESEAIFHIGRLTLDMLNRFIFGKALDSLIIGIICGIVCAIMNMPYTPLIAFVVGLTNMIPVFGPFMGAVPCIIILLIINPIKALEFLIFIIILQQVDGNIIGPRILGGSMGLPAMWVMFAILLGGALGGIMGMFLGVPLFSVVYILIKDAANRRVAEKNITVAE